MSPITILNILSIAALPDNVRSYGDESSGHVEVPVHRRRRQSGEERIDRDDILRLRDLYSAADDSRNKVSFFYYTPAIDRPPTCDSASHL